MKRLGFLGSSLFAAMLVMGGALAPVTNADDEQWYDPTDWFDDDSHDSRKGYETDDDVFDDKSRDTNNDLYGDDWNYQTDDEYDGFDNDFWDYDDSYGNNWVYQTDDEYDGFDDEFWEADDDDLYDYGQDGYDFQTDDDEWF